MTEAERLVMNYGHVFDTTIADRRNEVLERLQGSEDKPAAEVEQSDIAIGGIDRRRRDLCD